MGFKLVRIDSEDPCKIPLQTGTQLIGRGLLLGCDDKRVSRKHGELKVTLDSVTIKALHQNPCFYKKKCLKESKVLQQNCEAELFNGDQFGLLPDFYWYEIVYCSVDTDTQPVDRNQLPETNETETDTLRDNNATQAALDQSQEILWKRIHENTNEGSESPSLIQPYTDESPSATHPGTPVPKSESPTHKGDSPTIGEPESPSFTPRTEASDTTLLQPENPVSTQEYDVNDPGVASDQQKSPQKRPHSSDSQDSLLDSKKIKTEPVSDSHDTILDSKKIKTEPVDVKKEPDDVRPGPSGNQQVPSDTDKGKGDAPTTSSDQTPGGSLRERCMYGSNCYRKNPEHKAQFSHPADADWGAGDRGVCPWGRQCRRRDPRHWRDHQHPPGVTPPPPAPHRPGMQVVERRGNIFYINAHSVNFYDDHFGVEDSDGDSVDYDYEF